MVHGNLLVPVPPESWESLVSRPQSGLAPPSQTSLDILFFHLSIVPLYPCTLVPLPLAHPLKKRNPLSSSSSFMSSAIVMESAPGPGTLGKAARASSRSRSNIIVTVPSTAQFKMVLDAVVDFSNTTGMDLSVNRFAPKTRIGFNPEVQTPNLEAQITKPEVPISKPEVPIPKPLPKPEVPIPYPEVPIPQAETWISQAQANSPDAILQLLQERENAFKQSRNGNRRLTSTLNPVVRVFHALSENVGGVGTVSHTCHPSGEFFNATSSGPLPTGKCYICWNRHSPYGTSLEYALSKLPCDEWVARLPVGKLRATKTLSNSSSAWEASSGVWRYILRFHPL